MKNIDYNLCDLGCGANRLGILFGSKMIQAYKPKLYQKMNYISYDFMAEDVSLKNKKYYNTTYQATLNVYEANIKSFNNNRIPVLIGGDHSLALGSVKASLKEHGDDIGLIWIDAHADLNNFEVSETGHIHGMPIAGLIGINDNKYNNLGNNIKLKASNIVLFGTRSVDYQEEIIIQKNDIKNITDFQIKAFGLEKTLKQAINYLKTKVSKIHISFDLDSINPNLIKGVSTPVKGGLNLDEPLYIISELCHEFDVISVDIVEYNPVCDTDFNTLNYLEKLINHVEKSLVE